MKTNSQIYRVQFLKWESIAALALTIEIAGIIIVLNSKFNFITWTDVVRAAISSVLGFSLIFTITFAKSIYNEYNQLISIPTSELNLQLQEKLNEIESKYDLLLKAFQEQREVIEINLNKKDLSGSHDMLLESLLMLNREILHILSRKRKEIDEAFYTFGVKHEKYA